MGFRMIKEGVYWLGALNPELRVFDVIMETKWGTTYNSYLVKGSKKSALIELVKDGFGDVHLNNVRQLIDPGDIDYIIINHTEPDHIGSLAGFLKEASNATVIASQIGLNLLREIVNRDFPQMAVKDGDIIDLGDRQLSFISAPFLHWPDSMFTWLKEDSILFSGDVFGCHYSMDGDRIFNDEIEKDIIDAQRYYFDVIMSPFKKYMLKAIDKISGIKIDMICPSHGPVLREKPWETVNRIKDWSKDVYELNEPKKIFIGYVSAYGNRRRLAESIIKGIKSVQDFHIDMMDVSENPLLDVISRIDKADVVVMGSPTVNRDALPPVWEVLCHISVFKNKGKLAAAFGSYGWSGEAVGMMEERFRSLQMKVMQPGCRIKLVPDAKDMEEAEKFGKQLGRALLQKE